MRRTPYITCLCFLLLGCLLSGCLDDSASSANVSGSVLGTSFQSFSGVAELQSDEYIVTLSDSSLYDCDNTPSSAYLSVTFTVKAVGQSSASGNVGFNDNKPGAGTSEGADSGSVTISEINTMTNTIRGEIDATGSNSQVSGDFNVEICPS